MRRDKWLIKEIDLWQRLALIDTDTAAALKEHYAQKKNISPMIVLFSIIGTLLIGAGIILILAKNWSHFPLPIRIILAFIPLVASQILAVYTIKIKYASLAWRESIAILVTSSVFAVIAMVGQIFHLPGDYSSYILVCGLLALPMIYILEAASPLLVYYWTILNWAALEDSPMNALILLGLFSLGALFVYIELRKNKTGARLTYMAWVTAIAEFALVLIMGIMLECSLLLAVLCYFVLLLSLDELPEPLLMPAKIIGVLGGLVTIMILTFEDMWNYLDNPVTVGGGIMIVIMLAAAIFFAVRVFRQDKLKFSLVASLTFLCILRFLWATCDLSYFPYSVILMGFTNMLLFLIGVGFIVYGVKNASLLLSNIGMIAVCALIVMRFFDSDLDFLWRGIIFLLLGAALLLVNVKMLRAKKQPAQKKSI